MSTRWYRAYEGTVTDAKLGEVALVANCSRSVTIAAWHAILESAASENDGGRFTATPRRVAVILAEPVAVIEVVFNEMAEIGMICDGEVTAWKRRQFESDTSTERSRRHRERKRNGDATLHDVAATPPETETESYAAAADAHAHAREPIIIGGFQREEHVDIAVHIIAEVHKRWPDWLPPGDKGRVKQWMADGISRDTIESAIEAKIPHMNDPPRSFKYFDQCVSGLHRSLSQPIATSMDHRNDQRSDREPPKVDPLTAAFARRAAARGG